MADFPIHNARKQEQIKPIINAMLLPLKISHCASCI